ncbi:MAG: pseudouridine synthase [Metamycoplasmataceae bacterium]
MNLIKLKATKNDEGRTCFKYVIKVLDNVPISRIEKLFRKKDIKINDLRISSKDYIIKEDDRIWIYGLDESYKENELIEQIITFEKIFEDDNILVINKPINIAVHGEPNCLDLQVLSFLGYQKIDSFKPSHIGRLDKSTSGLIIYAKNYSTLVQMNKKTNNFEKYYVMKSDFPFEKQHFIFYANYDKKNKRYKLTNELPGEKMETLFFTQGNCKYARIITGKKHQIRITLQHLGYPIKGDRRYGGDYGKRVFLHSNKIVFHNLDNGLEYLNGTMFVSQPKW